MSNQIQDEYLMNTYLILDLTIHNMDKFREYIAKIPVFIEKYSGKYIIKGEVATVVEGDWQPERIVAIEFPVRENAEAFLQDTLAQSLFALRHQNTTSKLIMVDGG